MAQTRLGFHRGGYSAESFVGGLLHCEPAVRLLNRQARLSEAGALNSGILERLIAQDQKWSNATCVALSNGVFCEPGLAYAQIGPAVEALGLETVLLASQATNWYFVCSALLQQHLDRVLGFARWSAVVSQSAETLLPTSRVAALVSGLGILAVAHCCPDETRHLLASGQAFEPAAHAFFGVSFAEITRKALPKFGFSAEVVLLASQDAGVVPSSVNLCAQIGVQNPFDTNTAPMTLEEMAESGIGASEAERAALVAAESASRVSRWTVASSP